MLPDLSAYFNSSERVFVRVNFLKGKELTFWIMGFNLESQIHKQIWMYFYTTRHASTWKWTGIYLVNRLITTQISFFASLNSKTHLTGSAVKMQKLIQLPPLCYTAQKSTQQSPKIRLWSDWLEPLKCKESGLKYKQLSPWQETVATAYCMRYFMESHALFYR